MKTNLYLVLLLILFVSFSPPEIDSNKQWELKQALPSWTLETFKKHSYLNDKYSISDFINPYYFEFDFNGDSQLDAIIAIEDNTTKSKGLLIISRKDAKTYILGLENSIGGFDDFDWVDVWKVIHKSDVGKLLDGNSLDSTGDLIHIIKLESSSGYLFWNGDRFVWKQLGD